MDWVPTPESGIPGFEFKFYHLLDFGTTVKSNNFSVLQFLFWKHGKTSNSHFKYLIRKMHVKYTH